MGFLTGFATGAFGAISEGLDNITREEQRRERMEEKQRQLLERLDYEGIIKQRIKNIEISAADKRSENEIRQAEIRAKQLEKFNNQQLVTQLTAAAERSDRSDTSRYASTVYSANARKEVQIAQDAGRRQDKKDQIKRQQEGKRVLARAKVIDKNHVVPYGPKVNGKKKNEVIFAKGAGKGRAIQNMANMFQQLNSLSLEEKNEFLKDPDTHRILKSFLTAGTSQFTTTAIGEGGGAIPTGEGALGKGVYPTKATSLLSVYFKGVPTSDPIKKFVTNWATNYERTKDATKPKEEGGGPNLWGYDYTGAAVSLKPEDQTVLNSRIKEYQKTSGQYQKNLSPTQFYARWRALGGLPYEKDNQESKQLWNLPRFVVDVIRGDQNSQKIERTIRFFTKTGEFENANHTFTKPDGLGSVEIQPSFNLAFKLLSPSNSTNPTIPQTSVVSSEARQPDNNLNVFLQTAEGQLFLKTRRQAEEQTGLIDSAITNVNALASLEKSRNVRSKAGEWVIKGASYLQVFAKDLGNIYNIVTSNDRKSIGFTPEGKPIPFQDGTISKKISEFDKKIKSSKIGSEAERLAKIEALEYMLAYQMASILQGGVGGRTISDMDVKNNLAILKSAYIGKEGALRKLRMVRGFMEKKKAIVESYLSMIPSSASQRKHLNADIIQAHKRSMELQLKILGEQATRILRGDTRELQLAVRQNVRNIGGAVIDDMYNNRTPIDLSEIDAVSNLNNQLIEDGHLPQGDRRILQFFTTQSMSRQDARKDIRMDSLKDSQLAPDETSDDSIRITPDILYSGKAAYLSGSRLDQLLSLPSKGLNSLELKQRVKDLTARGRLKFSAFDFKVAKQSKTGGIVDKYPVPLSWVETGNIPESTNGNRMYVDVNTFSKFMQSYKKHINRPNANRFALGGTVGTNPLFNRMENK